MCTDCKAILTEYLGTQHRLLVMYVEIGISKRKKRTVGDAKARWWNLTHGNVTKLLENVKTELKTIRGY